MRNKIIIEGVIGWDVMPDDIREKLNGFGEEPVLIEINTPGGFIFDGVQIFNDIANYPGETETRITSLAASMGSYLALAGDKRTAESNATFMMHNAILGVYGNQHELRKYADVTENLSNMLAAKYMERSGKTLSEIKSMMDEETYLFGDQIKEAGFVQEIIQAKDKKNKDQAVALARYTISEAFKTIKSRPESFENIEKAAAIAGINSNKGNESDREFIERLIKHLNNHASSGYRESVNFQNANIKNESRTQPQERKTMTLAELLAQNPAAKIEHETAVENARKEGVKAEKERNNEVIEKLKPHMTADSIKAYPKTVEMFSDVLSGKMDISAITAHQATIDTVREELKSKDAAKETEAQGNTSGQQPAGTGITDEGDVIDEKGMDAVVNRLKGGI